jgi:hypothetical protein
MVGHSVGVRAGQLEIVGFQQHGVTRRLAVALEGEGVDGCPVRMVGRHQGVAAAGRTE